MPVWGRWVLQRGALSKQGDPVSVWPHRNNNCPHAPSPPPSVPVWTVYSVPTRSVRHSHIKGYQALGEPTWGIKTTRGLKNEKRGSTQKHLHACIHGSMIHSSQKVDTTPMSINRHMGKNMVHPHSTIAVCCKKSCSTNTPQHG